MRQEIDRPKAQMAANGALQSAFEFATHCDKKRDILGLIEVVSGKKIVGGVGDMNNGCDTCLNGRDRRDGKTSDSLRK